MNNATMTGICHTAPSDHWRCCRMPNTAILIGYALRHWFVYFYDLYASIILVSDHLTSGYGGPWLWSANPLRGRLNCCFQRNDSPRSVSLQTVGTPSMGLFTENDRKQPRTTKTII